MFSRREARLIAKFSSSSASTAYLGPQRRSPDQLFFRELYIGVIAGCRQQGFAQIPRALRRIAAKRVAIRCLRGVDVPVLRIAFAADFLHQLERGQHHRAARLRIVEERCFVDFLGVLGVPDEHQLDLRVLAGQKQIQQRKKALGEILLVLVHRGRNVHQAEHYGARDRLRPQHAVAIAQIEVFKERQPGAATAQALEFRGQAGKLLRVTFGDRLVIGGLEQIESRRRAPPSAMRRASALPSVRGTDRLDGEPTVV